MTSRALFFSLFAASLLACDSSDQIGQSGEAAAIDPMAEDSFFMRNPEIREDLLEQLVVHQIEHWINEDSSIGFRVKDTKEVDRLANEAIGVYISLQ